MTSYAVLVVGGGAAGLSAALVLSRARRNVVVVDAGTPRNAPATHMHGFLSRDGMPPADLLATGRKEVTGYGATIVDGTVRKLARTDGSGFQALLDDGQQLQARRVLVATGLHDELPPIPGLGCELDDQGWVTTGPGGATTVPGVWVAGNVANPRAQVITAAGEGSAAAIAINTDLVDADLRAAADQLEEGATP